MTVPIVWVTGVAGSGKSTVCRLIADSTAAASGGLSCQDVDEDGFSGRRWRANRSPVPADEPLDWTLQEWALDVARVVAWAHSVQGVGLLFGAVSNEDEACRSFAATVFLDVSPSEIERRLLTRSDNEFGKRPGERDATLSWIGPALVSHRKMGSVILSNEADPGTTALTLIRLAESLLSEPDHAPE